MLQGRIHLSFALFVSFFSCVCVCVCAAACMGLHWIYSQEKVKELLAVE